MTAENGRVPGPLSGIRVADFSRVLAGPYATMILAELGADVVKVEHPGHGDDTRAWGPPHAGGEAAYYLAVNRGKRSVALDVKHPSGREIAQRLCADADVVIENFRPGVAERLGLGHEQVRRANPNVVYCSISGFPGEDRPGFDATIQAESGYMHITGETPSKVGVAITDVLAGLNAAVAVLGALHRRAGGGKGERVEVSLIGSALSGLVNIAQSALVSGEEAVAYGNAHPTVVPYQTFHAADGRFVVAAGNDRLFRALCEAIGRRDLASDPRFPTNADRVRHRDALIAELEAVFATRPVEEWTALLGAAGVPTGKIRGVLEAIRTAGDATLEVSHPTAGPLELVRTGFTLESVPADRDIAPPPLLGQHTLELLAELGVAGDQAARLEQAGVIRQAAMPAAP
ncbi:CaiB/BaiF CoA transferase family protein [Streptosporangium carneum]|uniref:CoA transferase n=1 Tax=Streptosporangium carneum TaxID=47481 RepID=A0A9W6MHF0_9ACTN|nr:CoA transferase [Streptosporangium carneum]GLK14784.1 CoA transferase [Streptosporangium carneum]